MLGKKKNKGKLLMDSGFIYECLPRAVVLIVDHIRFSVPTGMAQPNRHGGHTRCSRDYLAADWAEMHVRCNLI